jgi:hypothetical protein
MAAPLGHCGKAKGKGFVDAPVSGDVIATLTIVAMTAAAATTVSIDLRSTIEVGFSIADANGAIASANFASDLAAVSAAAVAAVATAKIPTLHSAVAAA